MVWPTTPLGPGDPVTPLGGALLDPLRDDSGWVNCTVNAPYAGQGGQPPQVRRLRGVIHLRWGIANTGLVAGTTKTGVFTIPAGYRPASFKYPPAGSSAGATATWAIGSDGQVDIRLGATLGTYYMLDGISWPVD